MRHLLTDLRGNPISFASRRRQRRVRHPNLPALFYLVQSQDWEGSIRRCRSHPHEIIIQEDKSGNTPLHVACRLNPPSDVVRALLQSSQIRNTEGASPLHIAATHRCSADVITVLLESSVASDEKDTLKPYSPSAVRTAMGRAPIHYACMSFRGLGVDAFRVLLEATIKYGYVNVEADDDEYGFPDDDDEEDDNDMNSDPTNNSMVVNVMTMRDSTGQTPLGLLFRRYKERVKYVVKSVESLRRESGSGGSLQPTASSITAAITVQADLGELWEKARLIVGKLTEERVQREGLLQDDSLYSPEEVAVSHEAADWALELQLQSMRKQQQDQTHETCDQQNQADDHCSATIGTAQKKFRIVHASVGLTGYGCPPEMIMLAVSIHPNQVREMDEDGNLPLHIAAVASSYVVNHNPADADLGGIQSSFNNTSDEDSMVSDMSFLSSTTTCTKGCFDKVIKILLKQYPAAARVPHGRTGRLPLLLAIDAGRRSWDDGIKTLLDSYPPALENRRINLKLYPSILSLLASPSAITSNTESSWKARFRLNNKARRNYSSLTTLYGLLKAKPYIVNDAVTTVVTAL